jgi:uncharacterized protein (TIGR02147 family)
MKSIYQYRSYRRYLFDYYMYYKKKSGLNYASFSNQAGYRAENYLRLVIKGKKNLTIASIHKLAHSIGLTYAEEDYFSNLVLFNQAESHEEKSFYKRRLKNISKMKPQKLYRHREGNLLTKWWYLGVLAAVANSSEKESLQRVRDMTGLPSEKVESAIFDLLQQGVLKLHQNTYRVNEEHIIFHDRISSKKSYKEYLKEHLKLSIYHLENNYTCQAKFFSQTLTISRKSFEECVEAIDEFMEAMALRSEQEPAEDLVQLNIQFFPWSSRNKNERLQKMI